MRRQYYADLSDKNLVITDLELFFHYCIDECGIPEDLLGAHWAHKVVKLMRPDWNDDTINELIQRVGWH